MASCSEAGVHITTSAPNRHRGASVRVRSTPKAPVYIAHGENTAFQDPALSCPCRPWQIADARSNHGVGVAGASGGCKAKYTHHIVPNSLVRRPSSGDINIFAFLFNLTCRTKLSDWRHSGPSRLKSRPRQCTPFAKSLSPGGRNTGNPQNPDGSQRGRCQLKIGSELEEALNGLSDVRDVVY